MGADNGGVCKSRPVVHRQIQTQVQIWSHTGSILALGEGEMGVVLI